jgi:hypothetical protein
MDQFNIWGQIQEMSAGRYLVIATACPVTSGRQASFSMVVSRPDEARVHLRRLVEKLEKQVLAAGGRVVSVQSLPEHVPAAAASRKPDTPPTSGEWAR